MFLMNQPRPLFSFIFGLFKQISSQFFQQIYVKNAHPVYGAWIPSNDLQNMSLFALPLDDTLSVIPSKNCPRLKIRPKWKNFAKPGHTGRNLKFIRWSGFNISRLVKVETKFWKINSVSIWTLRAINVQIIIFLGGTKSLQVIFCSFWKLWKFYSKINCKSRQW